MKKTNILGVIAGIIIIILAVVMYISPKNIKHASYETFSSNIATSPQLEDDIYYGGDAYTGIQQAGAQTANNVYAVYDAIDENNKGLEAINKTMGSFMYQEYMNTKLTYDTIHSGFSALLFAIGLITLAKSIVLNNKKTTTVPEAYTNSPDTTYTELESESKTEFKPESESESETEQIE